MGVTEDNQPRSILARAGMIFQELRQGVVWAVAALIFGLEPGSWGLA
jgi:hypothetical protein